MYDVGLRLASFRAVYAHRVPSAWLMTKPSVEWNPGEFGCARSAPHRQQRVRPGVVGELRYARVGSHGRMSASYKRTAPRVDGDDPDDTPRRNRCVHIGHGTSAETKNPRSRRQRRRRSRTSVRASLATRPGLWFTPGGTSRGISMFGPSGHHKRVGASRIGKVHGAKNCTRESKAFFRLTAVI